MLVYNSDDTHNVSGDASLLVHVDQLPDYADITYMTYRLDNLHGSPYAVWEDAGQPVQPSGSLLQAMRDRQVERFSFCSHSLTRFNMHVQ